MPFRETEEEIENTPASFSVCKEQFSGRPLGWPMAVWASCVNLKAQLVISRQTWGHSKWSVSMCICTVQKVRGLCQQHFAWQVLHNWSTVASPYYALNFLAFCFLRRIFPLWSIIFEFWFSKALTVRSFSLLTHLRGAFGFYLTFHLDFWGITLRAESPKE